jgi:hypothetical protein
MEYHMSVYCIEKQKWYIMRSLKLESSSPEQKLRLLQKSVGDVNELAYVKQIFDQNILSVVICRSISIAILNCFYWHAQSRIKSFIFGQRLPATMTTFLLMVLVFMNGIARHSKWIQTFQKFLVYASDVCQINGISNKKGSSIK